MGTLLFLLAAGIAAWLFLTWWFADEEPAFAPGSEKRVTFKQVVRNALQDVRELFAPVIGLGERMWAFWAPRVTNTIGMSVIALDAAITQTPELHAAIVGHKWGLGALLAINLITYLSPRNAPARLPPRASPAGGLVNPAALA